MPALATIPSGAIAATAADAVLLAACGKFWQAYEQHNRAHDAWMDARAVADADPACPPSCNPADGKGRYEEWVAFMQGRGVWDMADKSNETHTKVGKALNAIFDSKASSLSGLKAKFDAYAMTLYDNGEPNHDFVCFDEPAGCWLDSIQADLNRMAREGAS